VHPDSRKAAEIETSFEKFKARRGGALSAAGSIAIPVYVHVINNGTGIQNGNVPDHMIRSQIAVLNASFGGTTGGATTAFSFELVGITRTTI
jgi:hypothetical protein